MAVPVTAAMRVRLPVKECAMNPCGEEPRYQSGGVR